MQVAVVGRPPCVVDRVVVGDGRRRARRGPGAGAPPARDFRSRCKRLWPPGPQAIGAATARVVEALDSASRRLHPRSRSSMANPGRAARRSMLPLESATGPRHAPRAAVAQPAGTDVGWDWVGRSFSWRGTSSPPHPPHALACGGPRAPRRSCGSRRYARSLLQDQPEPLHDRVLDFRHLDRPPQHALERRHAAIGDAARDDQMEVPRSVATFSAKPWLVIQRLMRTPIAAIFSSRPGGPTQTPVRPGTRRAVDAELATAR